MSPFFDIKITDALLALFSGLLVVVTWLLVRYTKNLWTSTDRLVEGAEETSRRKLRAYVSAKELTPKEREDCCTFRPVFRNSGSTPTRRFVASITGISLPERVTAETFFAVDGHFIEPTKTESAIIGPGLEVTGLGMDIPKDEVLRVFLGTSFLYLWGFAEYNDVFDGAKRHRTEFCCRVIVSKATDTTHLVYGFEFFGPYNGQDEDCYLKPHT